MVKEVETTALVFLAQYSLREGVSMFGNKAMEAVKEELKGIVENAVWDPTRWKDVPKQVRKKMIPTKVIMAPQIIAGVLDRLKGRLVVLGNLEKEDDRNIRAPTPSIVTVMIQAARAAAEERHVITFDVSQAFLNASIDDDRTYIRLPKKISEILLSIYPDYKEFAYEDGTIIIKLLKALYGFRRAPKLWRDTFVAVLLANDYNESTADECLYIKFHDDGTSTDASVHVHDGFLTTSNMMEAEMLLTELGKIFKLKVSRGDNINFIGLQFDFNRTTRDVSIIQPGYVSKILGDDIYKMVETPHTAELFSINDNAERLCDDNREKFHATVARCLYLALTTRPDILVATFFFQLGLRKGLQQLRIGENLIDYVAIYDLLCI